jgi:protein-disulfide isomerase
MDRRFLSILAGIIIVFAGIFIFNQNSNDKSKGGSNANAQPTNHVIGENTKGVTFVEYGDYQCPVCAAYDQPVKTAVAKYSKDIKFQFRNLPLTSIHPNAFAAARAAEAASLQNKFWEMNGKLYENQSSWSSATDPLTVFTSYAKELSLNEQQFKTDYASDKVNDAINADLKEFGKTKQTMSTPSFFINGEHIENTKLSDAQTNQPTVEKIGALLESYFKQR